MPSNTDKRISAILLATLVLFCTVGIVASVIWCIHAWPRSLAIIGSGLLLSVVLGEALHREIERENT